MKKFIGLPLVLVLVAIAFAGCFKDKSPSCVNNTLERDRTAIDSFITKSGSGYITWQPTLGFYAGTVNPGEGNQASSESVISFKYVRSLLNGTLIDSATFPEPSRPQAITMSMLANSPLEYYAISNLKQGGVMRFITPSSGTYGFGCLGAKNNLGVTVVPANSQLIYDISLLEVKVQ